MINWILFFDNDKKQLLFTYVVPTKSLPILPSVSMSVCTWSLDPFYVVFTIQYGSRLRGRTVLKVLLNLLKICKEYTLQKIQFERLYQIWKHRENLGTYIRWLLRNRCARKEQSLSFDQFTILDWLDREQSQIGILFYPKRLVFLHTWATYSDLPSSICVINNETIKHKILTFFFLENISSYLLCCSKTVKQFK